MTDLVIPANVIYSLIGALAGGAFLWFRRLESRKLSTADYRREQTERSGNLDKELTEIKDLLTDHVEKTERHRETQTSLMASLTSDVAVLKNEAERRSGPGMRR